MSIQNGGPMKTVTIKYPDNFEEWSLDLEYVDREYSRMMLVCPLQKGCKEEFNGGDIAYMRTKVDAHNRGKHGVETDGSAPTYRGRGQTNDNMG